ncbi:MAG: alpha/beta hydrolase-fold protein [Gammaproteobacteria bacterium]|nr:alpha/beta hydrolase-fold protein [Gammaproteobacteria bacterium]MDH4314349.1 alpha/beta hydrolase-fold protein [Gammaproteobacteria bacterium]MDH5214529.1 alpha/beta hydrolase-fold protein [Gammaproteobacteria bacterium]
MNPSLRKLFRKRAPGKKEIDAFVAKTDFPLVDGNDITFVYRGHAESVHLRCWISGFNAAQTFQQLLGTDLWAVTIELPPGSRIEYKFEVVANGRRSLIVDPLNPVLAHDPFGANSVCQGAGYERPAWTLPDPGARRGTIEEMPLASKAFGEDRSLKVYLPARFRRTRRYPLLIAHDGADYARFADLTTVLDNLIQSLEIPPMIVAMTQSPDRLKEYGADDRHAEFIGNELLPFMAMNYPLIDEPRARGLMGASFGGVATLHAAWRNPGVFDRLLLQSGSFAFSDLGQHERGPVFHSVVRFMNEFREKPGQPAGKIYMNCGIYESLIYENRSLVPRLQQQGIDVLFEEARDAHNWENWRDRLRNGLTWLFPGPVWIVYE